MTNSKPFLKKALGVIRIGKSNHKRSFSDQINALKPPTSIPSPVKRPKVPKIPLGAILEKQLVTSESYRKQLSSKWSHLPKGVKSPKLKPKWVKPKVKVRLSLPIDTTPSPEPFEITMPRKQVYDEWAPKPEELASLLQKREASKSIEKLTYSLTSSSPNVNKEIVIV